MNQERMGEAREEGGHAEGDTEFERDLALLASQAKDTIEQFVHEKPHAALGLAAALGFVIGGGLTPRRLVRIGMAAGGPTLTKQIAARLARMAGEALLESQPRAGEASKPGKPTRPRRPKKEKDRAT